MFKGSLKDLLGYFIDSVDEEWIQRDLRMRKCTPKKLKELLRTYKRIVVDLGSVTSNNDRQIINRRIRTYTRKLNYQLSLFLIRRTRHSKFFDYTIMPLDLIVVIELACSTKN